MDIGQNTEVDITYSAIWCTVGRLYKYASEDRTLLYSVKCFTQRIIPQNQAYYLLKFHTGA
jgi:hypothetical protein